MMVIDKHPKAKTDYVCPAAATNNDYGLFVV